MLNNNNMLMDWDDAIENDGQEFIILPEGDYVMADTYVFKYDSGSALVFCQCDGGMRYEL